LRTETVGVDAGCIGHSEHARRFSSGTYKGCVYEAASVGGLSFSLAEHSTRRVARCS